MCLPRKSIMVAKSTWSIEDKINNFCLKMFYVIHVKLEFKSYIKQS